MTKPKVKPYPRLVKELMAKKTSILSKAHLLSEMEMPETALPLWASAGSYEELAGPLREETREEVQGMLRDCLGRLAISSFASVAPG